jgi:hypothetical protein
MQFLAIYLYVAAVGFVAAGVLASFVQLVSGEPMRFGLEPKSILDSLAACCFASLPAPPFSCATRGAGSSCRPAR